MRSTIRAWAWAAASTTLLYGSGADAQSGGYPGGFGPGPGTQAGGYRPQGASAIPAYGNPAVNPYLNPYAATQLQGTSPDVAMYYFAANQMNGGIGSGVISGTRPAPGMPAGSASPRTGQGRSREKAGTSTRNTPFTGREAPATARAVAEMPLATSVPGASASPFFNRGFQSGSGAAKYYNRSQTHFGNNGR